MATDTQAARTAPTVYRLTVPKFEAMIDAELFGDDRVELLGGVLIKMTTNPPHDFTVMQSSRSLGRVLPEAEWTIREEKALRLGLWWRPQPDIAVVRGPLTAYATRSPIKADVVLLIEVADSTYATDRGAKWRQYAAAGVPLYLIANIGKRRVEGFTGPVGRGKSARYQHSVEYGEDAEVPILIDGREFGRVAVRTLFP